MIIIKTIFTGRAYKYDKIVKLFIISLRQAILFDNSTSVIKYFYLLLLHITLIILQ